MKKWLVGLVLGLALVFALAACSSGDSDDTSADDATDATEENNSSEGGESSRLAELKESGKIVVGFANEKPYAYQEGDELKGVAVDVATEVLNRLGIDEVEGHLADFGELIPGLEAKKFDIITASMAIIPDRCENVAFGEPEVLYGEGLIVEAGNPLNLHSYKDIADNPDVIVSIMSGATENDFVVEE